MKKQISTEQTEANIKEVLRLLAETPVKLEQGVLWKTPSFRSSLQDDLIIGHGQ